MNQSTVHNLVWFPIFLIGLLVLCFGLLWVMHPEPWLIDQPQNEDLLQTSFQNLFSTNINKFLPYYLKVVYSFFGLWLIAIGILTLIYVKVTRLGTNQARFAIHSTFLVVLCLIYYLIIKYLPTSPLIPAVYILSSLLGISIYYSLKLKE